MPRERTEGQQAVVDQMQKRVDLRPLIEEMQAGTYVPEIPDEVLTKFPAVEISDVGGDAAVPPEAKRLWKELKQERNAFVAILAARAWQKLESYGSSPSFVRQEPNEIPVIIQLFKHTYRAYAQHIQTEMKLLGNEELSSHDPLQPLYRRFITVMRFANRTGITDQEPAEFVQGGIGTATQAMWSLIEIVPRLAREKGLTLTQDQIETTIRGAYGPVVVQFASMNLNVSIPLFDAMSERREWTAFKKEFFDLVPNEKGGYKLTLDHDRLLEVKNPEGVPYLTLDSDTDTTWCPARYLPDVDVIGGLRDWCISLARQEGFPTIDDKGEKR